MTHGKGRGCPLVYAMFAVIVFEVTVRIQEQTMDGLWVAFLIPLTLTFLKLYTAPHNT